MNVQRILDRIEQDAGAQAQAALAQAQERVLWIKAESERSIAQAREKTLEQAREQAHQLSQRMHSMASLEARKDDLADKRSLLDRVFDMALAKLDTMPQAQARAHGLTTLVRIASGSETVIASSKSPWCDESFIQEANAAMVAAGRQGNLSLSSLQRPLSSGGFIVQKGGMELNCTYQALLDMSRLGLEADVAALLFG